jgi:hypothetical protein
MGRYAWVSFKETLGMPRRNDRSFYVDRFVRALQTGTLPRSYGIMATGKDDGAGSQAQAAMSAICLAQAFGLEYIHRPFTLVEHAEGSMETWVRECEDYFNLGAGALTLSDRSGPVVPLDELLMAPEKWPQDAIVAAPHYLHYCNQAPQAWEQARPLLRAKYRENKTLGRADNFTITIHVRRGDVSADANNKARGNFTPNAAFLRSLDILRDAVATLAPRVRIKLFSQGSPEIFADFARAGCELNLDVPALATHAELVAADVLITSKGAFSYTAAVLNDGITLYDPQKYRPLSDWIVRTPDGNFDLDQFARRLDAHIERSKR